MTEWKKLGGGVTNLVVAVCLPQVRGFHRLIEESGGEADEHSFVLGFQVYQELLAAGWQLGRRCSGPRVRYDSGENDPNAKDGIWLLTIVVTSMVLYQLNVRYEARVRDDDTWNWWMLREGEVYDLGGVPEPQAEEPRQWAAFRQAVMRKMGPCSDQWQQVLRLRAGPDPVIDPRVEEPEEEPVPGYRPPGE